MRLAVFQCPVMRDDPAGVTRHVARALAAAGGDSVDLAVFPETFLLGHAYDATVIAARADRAPAAIAAFCAAMKDVATTIVLGTFERCGPAIVNAALVIERGTIRGRYAKMHPNEPGVTAGDAVPIFAKNDMPFGINICADANHPGTAQRVADGGAMLIVYPLDNLLPFEVAERWRLRSVDNLVARARQTGCWIASADVVGKSGSARSFGCSAIVRPDGTIAARVPEGVAGVACYDIIPR
jgi:predicted amidohydrolase